MANKKKCLIFIIILLIICVINKLEVENDKVVLTVVSESQYFYIRKHKAPKEVIKAFKQKIKKDELVKYALETEKNLLYYEGFNGILKEISIENSIICDKNCLVDFSFTRDNNYFTFLFNSIYLPLINEIEIELIINGKSIGWALIPIATKYYVDETVIQWKTLDNIKDSDDVSFRILSCRNTTINEPVDITSYVISKIVHPTN